MNKEIDRHYSAFAGELNKHFHFIKGFRFLDLTLGDGGHTEEALKQGCLVVSFDLDHLAIQRAKTFLEPQFHPLIIEDYQSFDQVIPEETPWIVVKTNFINLSESLNKLKLPLFDGVLVDLGPSQFQILSEDRGFSFDSESLLDMRLDRDLAVTAKDLINVLNEGELRQLLELGDEPYAKVIARVIVSQRQISPIETGKQLADLVFKVKHGSRGKTHPATQTFMALRMAVNLERENLERLLIQLPEVLKPSGIIGIISFHSGEDRIVKQFFQAAENKQLCVINPKPILPSAQELQISQRTRSAKLRLAKKYI